MTQRDTPAPTAPASPTAQAARAAQAVLPALSVRGLTVDYAAGRGSGLRRAVEALDLDVPAGGALGLVGESGSGKSTVALALTRYLPRGARVSADRLEVVGTDVLSLDATGLRRYRQRQVGVVYQEPARALNPTAAVGAQVAEVHRLRGLGRDEARAAVVAGFGDVGLPDATALARRYPHELSGGQQQRVVIAMALASRPQLLVLDEPTTGLDSLVQAGVLELIDRLRAEHGFASLLISHDLPLVAAHCDEVVVLRHGRLVEATRATAISGAGPGATGPAAEPAHAYTRELVAAVPALRGPVRTPVPADGPPLLVARGLTKTYGSHRALDHVDLHLHRGEALGVVGGSGSGKTTLGRVLAGLVSHGGTVDVDAPTAPPPVQVVFQSPDASLNPRRTVRQVLRRSARLLGGARRPDELVELVGLPTSVLDALPHQLSGGQKQRVAIARAFAGRAPVVVCDEPTSALDVSVQATVLDLLVSLQEQTGVAYLFISHDLAVVRRIAHRVAVVHDGAVVEVGDVADVLTDPRHPRTRQLVEAALGHREPSRSEPAGAGPLA